MGRACSEGDAAPPLPGFSSPTVCRASAAVVSYHPGVKERRTTRNRVWSLIAVLLAVTLMIVGLGGLLQMGSRSIDRSIYRQPYLTLEALAKAETRFRQRDLDGDGKKQFAASLTEMGDAGCITQKLAGGEVGGYRYEVIQADANTWSMRASPVAITSQTLFYFVDQSHTVRARVGAPADATSEVFWDPLRGMQWIGGGVTSAAKTDAAETP